MPWADASRSMCDTSVFWGSVTYCGELPVVVLPSRHDRVI